MRNWEEKNSEQNSGGEKAFEISSNSKVVKNDSNLKKVAWNKGEAGYYFSNEKMESMNIKQSYQTIFNVKTSV